MALPTSGPITSDDIQSEFNQTVGSPFDIEDYYRGGGIVPATSGVAGGVAEVQSVDFSGTASNVITVDQNEIVHIDIESNFDAGVTDPNAGTTFTLGADAAVGATALGGFADNGLPGFGEEFVWDGTTYEVQGLSLSPVGIRITPALVTAIPETTEFFFPRPTLSTAYSFRLDTGGTVFTSAAITGSFADNATATQALTALGTAITGNWPGTTASAVSTIPGVNLDITVDFSGVTFPLTTGTGSTALNALQMTTSSDDLISFRLPQSTTYNSAADLVMDFMDASSSFLNQSATNGTYTLTSVDDTITIVSTDSYLNRGVQFIIGDSIFATGTDGAVITDNNTGTEYTSTDGLFGIVNSGEPVWNRISIDTNQTTNIAQTFALTRNSGTESQSRLQAVNGSTSSGTASTYTLTDYAGTELASLTATSGETLTSILGRLETVVDDNTETPIDFSF